MTEDEIRNLPAGGWANALVADKVMGEGDAHRLYRMANAIFGAIADAYDDYSEDIGAAWKVVEKMGEKFDSLSLTISGKWKATVGAFEATAETAPLAICRVALLAVADQP